MNPMRIAPWLALVTTALGTPVAQACGGFLCDAGTMEPVDQKAERILFDVHGDGTITTFVEVSYLGNPEQFAWVIPIPEPISAGDVDVHDAMMFDTLEALTAPSFVFDPNSNGGIGFGCAAEFDLARDENGEVQVVDTFTVGPYGIEIIDSDDGAALVSWLVDNGYDLPDAAEAAIDHYVGEGMSFMGVKLVPEEITEGPLDTLSFTYHSGAPMIPLILTGIAAVPEMPIVTYVVADEPMQLGPGYDNLDFPFDVVRPTDDGTDYVELLQGEIDAVGGHAFVLEWADTTDTVRWNLPVPETLAEGRWMGRWRTYLDPEEMTVDPTWVPNPNGALFVSRARTVNTQGCAARSARSAFDDGRSWTILPLLLLLGRRRRQ